MKRVFVNSLGILATVVLAGGIKAMDVSAETPQNGWYVENGKKYWYVNGERQGLDGRGSEIYDPASDAWYWLEAEQNGAMAVNKDVYQESSGGKWVRYDANGHMVKGDSYKDGAWYRFDEVTGAMIKGESYKNGAWYRFDDITGKMIKGEYYSDGDWYRYDEATGAMIKGAYYNNGNWYRYNEMTGAMVKGEYYADGAWYRYDENTGIMVRGWYSETTQDGTVNTYYYDPNTGKMVKGETTINGVSCVFDSTTGVGLDQKWYVVSGAKYWYEGGKRQGTEGRGKEIYDPASNAWYWLDANAQGRMATNKDVYQESNGGKWVRYDNDGHMIKGHNYKDGSWYCFDQITGAMIKGWYSETLANGTVNTYYYNTSNGKRVQGLAVIDGENCAFDDSTGIALDKKWRTINGVNYWYEGGKRQGTTGSGKEIYDAASASWYWLDGTAQGAMAVNKDIYRDGKWVRYDQYGHMVKGWNEKDGKTYYFDLVTGAMVKGTVTIDNIEYTFNKDTGVLERSQGDVPLNYVWDVVKYTYKNPNGSVDYYKTMEYDDKDRLTREITSAANGNLKDCVTYSYDNSGNLIRQTVYNERSQWIYEYQYTYDSNDRETSVLYTNRNDSSKSYRINSEYNADGNLSRQIIYNGAGTKTGAVSCFYNSAKQLLQKSIYTMNNNQEVLANFYIYKYDSAGNTIEEEYYKYVSNAATKEVLIYRDTFAYDRLGNCTSHVEYDEKNQLKQYTNSSYYTYEGVSYERKVMTYKADGSVITGYEYVRNGATPTQYVKYGAKNVMEYYTIYDTKSYPVDINVTTHTTTDNVYYSNGTLKQVIETEYRLNRYEN